MTFNPSTADLWSEVQEAMRLTEDRTKHSMSLVRRMTTRWYDASQREGEADPENFVYAYVSNMIPAMGLDNPKVKCHAARIIGHKQVAQAMTDGINSVVEDINYREVMERVVTDFFFSRGVMLHRLDEETRSPRGVVTPAIRRIAPTRFFIDALASSPAEAEFCGHWYYADVDELRGDPEVNDKAREALNPDEGGNMPNDNNNVPYKKPDGGTVGRKRIRVYNVWIKSRNTLRVLIESDQAVELYPEMPYYGPNNGNGPYQLYDAYEVPDEVWPLAPLIAVKDQNDDLNEHARNMGEAAARRKSVGLVEGNNPDLAKKLENATDGEFLLVRGITGNFVKAEVGGVTKEQYQFTEYIRNRLDRISGLTATVQGNVGAADTATEASIANAHLNARVEFLKRKVMEGVSGSLGKIGWFLFHTEGIIIPVNRRDAYTGEVTEGMFFGGPAPTDMGATWDDFQIAVEINTLQKQAEAKDNMLAFYSLFNQIALQAPQTPWIRSMNVLRDLEAAFDLEGKSEEWLIPELFGAFNQPPMLPPSMFGGQEPVPPRGGDPGRNFPRQQLANGTNQQAGPQALQSQQQGQMGQPGQQSGQPAGGNMTRAGQTGGPRPGQQRGSPA